MRDAARPVAVRPMAAGDVEAVDALSYAALQVVVPGEDEAVRAARGRARQRWLLERYPGGSWVAEDDGELVGVAAALVREGVWGLSLFAVAPERQGYGIGRQVLEPALRYGEDARGGLIYSSPSPAAMRRYALSGFDLRPCVSAGGIADRRALPAEGGRVREAGAEALDRADAIARAVRGAGHGDDLAFLLDWGSGLLVHGDRGFAVHRGGSVQLLAARDDEAAAGLLWGALARSAPGATVSVDQITAGQDWAVRTLLAAGLQLSPDGPLFTRGELGPLRPYLPSGMFL